MGSSDKINHNLLSKIANNDQHGENSPYFDGWKAYDKDPFHPTLNPDGVIQMGLAENQLCADLIKVWIKENQRASICTTEGMDQFLNVSIFQDYHGLKEFRQAIAEFMGRVRGRRVAFDPDRIVMSGGATGASENIVFCLADPGDAFLLPTPYYPAFERDLRWRTGVQIIPVESSSANAFTITKEALESAYLKAQETNTKVKGLIIANPSNPLGTTLDRDTLKTLVSFITNKRIHLVCDEIYAATVFGSPEFVSIAEIIEETKFVDRDLIHIVYSLSKDMGLPGFRVGIVYSYNDFVVSCARKMSSFGLVSSQTQHFLGSMLSDEKFIDNFLSQSSMRLAKRHHDFTIGLQEMGIDCLKGNAGLFVWMDLRRLLNNQTFESEMELWRVIVNEVKLNISPGFSFRCSEPGWFRFCFANMDEETFQVGIRRIQSFVHGGKHTENNSIKKRVCQQNLSLGFSSRIYDEHVLSPNMVPPHSPILRI